MPVMPAPGCSRREEAKGLEVSWSGRIRGQINGIQKNEDSSISHDQTSHVHGIIIHRALPCEPAEHPDCGSLYVCVCVPRSTVRCHSPPQLNPSQVQEEGEMSGVDVKLHDIRASILDRPQQHRTQYIRYISVSVLHNPGLTLIG